MSSLVEVHDIVKSLLHTSSTLMLLIGGGSAENDYLSNIAYANNCKDKMYVTETQEATKLT